MNKTVKAIVLNKKQTNEQDLLVILLTEHDGKQILKAKGASKITSSRLGSLSLGNTIKVSISQNYISQASTTYSFLQNQKDLTQTNLLFFILEIVNKLVATGQQTDGVFASTQDLIQSIEKKQLGSFLRHELALIQALGYGIPTEVKQAFKLTDYKTAQKLLQIYLSDLSHSRLVSTKLFS